MAHRLIDFLNRKRTKQSRVTIDDSIIALQAKRVKFLCQSRERKLQMPGLRQAAVIGDINGTILSKAQVIYDWISQNTRASSGISLWVGRSKARSFYLPCDNLSSCQNDIKVEHIDQATT